MYDWFDGRSVRREWWKQGDYPLARRYLQSAQQSETSGPGHFSDVLSNTARGVLAEFLVGSALGVVDGVRVEWDSFDLLYEGAKIEIKSTAYVQRWFQKIHSDIGWTIGEQRAWNAATGTYSEERKRWADCYVLCLYAHIPQVVGMS